MATVSGQAAYRFDFVLDNGDVVSRVFQAEKLPNDQMICFLTKLAGDTENKGAINDAEYFGSSYEIELGENEDGRRFVRDIVRLIEYATPF